MLFNGIISCFKLLPKKLIFTTPKTTSSLLIEPFANAGRLTYDTYSIAAAVEARVAEIPTFFCPPSYCILYHHIADVGQRLQGFLFFNLQCHFPYSRCRRLSQPPSRPCVLYSTIHLMSLLQHPCRAFQLPFTLMHRITQMLTTPHLKSGDSLSNYIHSRHLQCLYTVA